MSERFLRISHVTISLMTHLSARRPRESSRLFGFLARGDYAIEM